MTKNRRDDLIDTLIKPPRVVYAGHDESLELRARERKTEADRINAQANKLRSRDDARSKIHIVGR